MLIHLNWAALITFCGVASSLFAVVLAAQNRLAPAMVCLILAGLADLFDGLVARLCKSNPKTQALGAELDSLADVVSFGVSPILVFYFGDILTSPASMICLGTYLFAVFQRLAHFNINGLVNIQNTQYYTGLPVTYTALVLPLAFLIERIGHFHDSSLYFQLILYTLAFLFISKLPIPKPKGIAYLIFPLVAVAAIAALLFGV